MSGGQPYSVQKIVHHPLALEALRERRHQNPTTIHFMPALACNQHCEFCLPAGVLVETSRGRVPVEDVRVGDEVVVGDLRFPVRSVGSRWANNLQRLEVSGYEPLFLTGEHPVFSRQGFVGADAVRPGDWVAADVRLRLRGAGGTVHAREEVALENTYQGPPVARIDGDRGSAQSIQGSHDHLEPDEAARSGGEGLRDIVGSGVLSFARGGEEGLGRGQGADARPWEPNEGPGHSTEGRGVRALADGEDEDRGVVSRGLAGCRVQGPRDHVDWSPEPRLPAWEAEVRGGHPARSVQLVRADSQDGRGLRHAHDSALRVEGLDLPCGLPAVASTQEADDWASDGDRVVYRGREVRHLRFGEVLVRRPVAGRFRVYNLSVTGAEAYVANGVLTHNCSYGHRTKADGEDQQGWKNMALMSDAFLPRAKARELVRDWVSMGVKAVELTGGGEPLIWPFVDEWFQAMAQTSIDVGMVTNGTALTAQRAKLFASTSWKWARVSIDAGDREHYRATRRVPGRHWDLAWEAVERLVAARTDGSEKRVGVGFVVDRQNWTGVYDLCRRAAEVGADNVRVAMSFTPQGLARIPAEAGPNVLHQIQAARDDFEDEHFRVNALFGERCDNLASPAQDYEFCAAKEVLCVVGGDQRVYSCCTLAFNEAGLIGSIADRSFADMWWAPETLEWFSRHDAREACKVPCLYEQRNKRALGLMALPIADVATIAAGDSSIHRNFI